MDKEKRECYAIELIKSALEELFKMRPSEMSRAFLPYCIVKMDEKNWLPLNREYKPLGLNGNGCWVKYEDYQMLYIPDDHIDTEYRKIEKPPIGDHPYYFLFSDSSAPVNKRLRERYREEAITLFKLDRKDV